MRAARPLDVEAPEPTRLGEVSWLEPYPDSLLAAGDADLPDVRVEARESISLAFVTALQLLSPRQRAALVLRDVLGYRAAEVADLLATTEESVASALKRARAAVRRAAPDGSKAEPVPGSPEERALVERFTAAYEGDDVDGVVALLAEDVWLRMPPLPLEYRGRRLAGEFLRTVAFRPGRAYRLVETRANGAPAFGAYLRDPAGELYHAVGLLVVVLAGDEVVELTRFDAGVLGRFGFPRTLPQRAAGAP